MKYLCWLIGVGFLIGCSSQPPMDVDLFIDQGFGSAYTEDLISNPEELPTSFGPVIRVEYSDFDSGIAGGFDQIKTTVFKNVAVEYYTYKNTMNHEKKFSLKAFLAVPGETYSGLTLGDSEGDVRHRIPQLGATDYWLSSSKLHEVAFDFRSGKLSGITWTYSSE